MRNPFRRLLESDVIIPGTLISILYYLYRPIKSPDFWWHLSTGKYIVLNRIIPKTDIFSHTKFGVEWIDHSWLSQVLFYVVHNLGGVDAVVLLKVSVIAAILVFLYLRMSRHNSDFMIAVYFIALYHLITKFPLERPRIFTLLFVVLFISVFEKFQEKETALIWVVPLMTIAWSNLHGGFILGFLVIVVYALDSAISKNSEKTKKYVSIGALSILATFITPYGYKTLIYPFQYIGFNTVHASYIDEWMPPTFKGFTLFTLLVLVAVPTLLSNKSKVKRTDFFLFLFFTIYSLYSRRVIPLFGVVALPIFFRYFELSIVGRINSWRKTNFDRFSWELLKGFRYERYIEHISYLAFYLVLLGVLFSYSTSALKPSYISGQFPEDAANTLIEHKIEGNLFNEYEWGGYLIWKLYPQNKVFIDGRADIYEDFLEEYLYIYEAKPGFEEKLDKYNVSIVLVYGFHGLSQKLASNQDWEIVYGDSQTLLFKRKT